MRVSDGGREGGRTGRKEGGRGGGGADTELKTKTPHVNVGKYLFHMITTLVKLKLFAPT